MKRTFTLFISKCLLLFAASTIFAQAQYSPTMTSNFVSGFGCNELNAYDRASAVGFGDCDDTFSGLILFTGPGAGYGLYNSVAPLHTFGIGIGDDVITAYIEGWPNEIYLGSINDSYFPLYSTPFVGPKPQYLASDGKGGVYVSDGQIIAKVSSLDYATLLYSFDLGKYGASVGGIRANNKGEVYAVGWAGPGFPTTPNAVQSTGIGPIVFKLNALGTDFKFATYLDTAGAPFVLDASGAAYLLRGNTVTKLNSSGTKVTYLTRLWSGANANSIAVDAYGQVYLAGTTTGGLPMVHAPQPTIGSAEDGFIAVLNPTGKRIVYSSYLGGAGITAVSGGVAGDGTAAVIGTEISYVWDGKSAYCPSTDWEYYAYCSQPGLYDIDFGPFRFAQLPNQQSFRTAIGTLVSRKVAFQNLGNVPIKIVGVSIYGYQFSQVNNCPVVLNPDKTCQITISYAPTSLGGDTGALSITTDAVNSPHVMPIYGNAY